MIATEVPTVICDRDVWQAALGQAQLASLNAGEGLEGRARRPPALRAMAIGGVEELLAPAAAAAAS